MFDECKSLAELNAARIKAVTAGGDVMAINNAYNEQRYKILNARKPYTVISFKKVPTIEKVLYQALPIGGASPEAGTIMFRDGKWYV